MKVLGGDTSYCAIKLLKETIYKNCANYGPHFDSD